MDSFVEDIFGKPDDDREAGAAAAMLRKGRRPAPPMTSEIEDLLGMPAGASEERPPGKHGGDHIRSRELYSKIDPRVRAALEENDLGFNKIGEIAKAYAKEGR